MIYIYLTSLFMLILLSVLSGDIHFLSLPHIAGLTMLNLLGYLAWQAGGPGDRDEKRRSIKR